MHRGLSPFGRLQTVSSTPEGIALRNPIQPHIPHTGGGTSPLHRRPHMTTLLGMNENPISRPYDEWMTNLQRRGNPRIRLICFPYAGGGPSAYSSWGRHLPDWIEVLGVAPPGRESRADETSVRSMSELVEPVVEHILADRTLPFAIFGHSMGAVVGYEAARRCSLAAAPPVHLFLSGRGFPSDLPAKAPLHRLSDGEFLTRIRESYGGLPEELDEFPEVLAQARDLLRDDLEILERFEPTFDPELELPLTLLWSSGDRSLSVEQMLLWRRVTRGATSHHIFRGSHFYLLERPAEVAQLIADRLGRGQRA